ncbi:capsule biosynthesis protein CapB [Candidatus Vecturithrix granuli]|uniref:Capsule biosynthesis protein CapB n=1 Tax=Vecturithrix granuli TaxID=1499967 RepID=A0A081C618_VECG1|nr:capsule biosynthesis protein CapB [Candidatus Vecturithrix granuli]
MIILLILATILLFLGILEYARHLRQLSAIPIRIHVNGTRGKSTTTRLIAGALREAGWRVLAKTTGSAPRIIFEDDHEQPVKRRGSPNIIEQKRIVRLAAKRKAKALVLECMAIHPETQWISEHRLVRSTIGVITNVRQDHSDLMGATAETVANVLSLTIPAKGLLVLTDTPFTELFCHIAARQQTSVHVVQPADISLETLNQFPYPTFQENVACTLKVCSLLGVSPEIALRGMQKAAPDLGAMHVYSLKYRASNIYLVNAFAANDPESTSMAWQRLQQSPVFTRIQHLPVIGVLNNRSDRGFRVRQLAEWVTQAEIPMEHLILTGDTNLWAKQYLQRQERTHPPIHVRRKFQPIAQFCDWIHQICQENLLLFGFGNMKGAGEQLVEYFETHGETVL